MKFIVLTFLAIFLPTTTTSPASEPSPPPVEKATAVSTNETSYIQQLKDLIDSLTSQSKEAGEKGKTITKETGHWIKEDFKKIGDWEYKQITLELSELTTLEETLNEAGADRWNCFWVQQHGQTLHLLLKRPAISYLHKLSQIDFIRMLSIGAGNSTE